VVKCRGKPCSGFVYAIAEDGGPRLFQPFLSGADGHFEMNSLAPDDYIIFATDIEMSLDVHDPAELASLRNVGKIVRLRAGKNPPLRLDLEPEVNSRDGPFQ
jgi:hypothetical protein